MGMSVNHISAVAIPLVGGMLWALGHEVTFMMGSALAVMSLISVQFIPGSIAKWGMTEAVQGAQFRQLHLDSK
jgi:hypothetical protein